MNKSFHIVASLLMAMLLLCGESWAEDNQSGSSEEYEMDSWSSAKEINTLESYEIYLAEHPDGRHAKFAQAAMNKIKKAENPKGSEENTPSRAKDAGDGANKQPVATPATLATPALAPAASGTEPKAATPANTPTVTSAATPAATPTAAPATASALASSATAPRVSETAEKK